MKGYKTIILVVFTILLLGGFASESSLYPDYLAGNPNLKLIDGHMGTGYYYDSTSLVNKLYNPPYYQLAVNVAVVNNAHQGNTNISKVVTLRFFYDMNRHQVILLDVNSGAPIRQLNPQDALAKTRMVLPAAEKAFYQSYNLKFFNKYDYSFYTR